MTNDPAGGNSGSGNSDEDDEDDDDGVVDDRMPNELNAESLIRFFDEETTIINRTWPQAMFGFYRSLIDQGFSPRESMDFTHEYMVEILPHLPQREY